jgi:hypothetical protein
MLGQPPTASSGSPERTANWQAEWDRRHRIRSAPFGLVRDLGYGEHGDPLTPDECAHIRRGRCPVPDSVIAPRLLQDVADAMEAVATSGPPIRLLNGAYVRENGALTASLLRLGLRNPNPHRDLSSWRSYYTVHMSTWDQRRSYLSELFRPVLNALPAVGQTSAVWAIRVCACTSRACTCGHQA